MKTKNRKKTKFEKKLKRKTLFFRTHQTFARFFGRGLQNFFDHFGLILKLRDVEFAAPFCFRKN